MSAERSEMLARHLLLFIAKEFEDRALFALPAPEARPRMAALISRESDLSHAVEVLTADGDTYLRQHPRTATEIGQDAAWDLGISGDLRVGDPPPESSAKGVDRLFEDLKILEVQHALIWMRQRDRGAGAIRRDYLVAGAAFASGLCGWAAGLSTWADAPLSMFAFLVGALLMTVGAYRGHASSWLGRGLIPGDFSLRAKVNCVGVLAGAVLLLSLVVGPWHLSVPLRIGAGVTGAAFVYLARRVLERGNRTARKVQDASSALG